MPLFYIYSQMLTDSSAEASALGSGPRGRRFKSALSEKRPSIVIVQRNRGNPLYLHLKCRFSGVFFVMNVQLIAEIPLPKTTVRQSELQSCQNLQYDRDIHGNYSTVGVPLLNGSTDRRKENSKISKKCPTFPRLQVCPITNFCYLNNVNIF